MQDNKRLIQGQQDTLGGLYLPVVWPLGYYKRSNWGIRTHIFILNNPKFCLTFACSITSILNFLQCLFCLYICDLQFWFLQKFCSSLHFFFFCSFLINNRMRESCGAGFVFVYNHQWLSHFPEHCSAWIGQCQYCSYSALGKFLFPHLYLTFTTYLNMPPFSSDCIQIVFNFQGLILLWIIYLGWLVHTDYQHTDY